MKVLHLISGGDTGGAKSHTISLMKALADIIDVKMICFIKDTFYDDALKAGIDISVFPQKNRMDLSVIPKLRRYIKENGIDIVHCHGARANFIALFLKHHISIPMVSTIHSDYKLDFKDNIYKYLIFTPLNSWALKSFDNYITVSEEFKNMMIDRGYGNRNIYSIYNGLDFSVVREGEKPEKFLSKYGIEYRGQKFIGIAARLDAVKNVETFINAAKIFYEDCDADVEFLIAGDGAEYSRLKEIAKDFGLDKKIHFLGFVKDNFSFFNLLYVNTLTSLSESFPYVILEGASKKVPMVSTDVGGVKKVVIHGETGYVYAPGDYRKLAEYWIKLVNDEELRDKLGNNIYDLVMDKYSSDAMAKRHIEIYDDISASFYKLKKRVTLMGYYGFDNSGDDAILKAIVQELRKTYERLDIAVFSKNPKSTMKIYDVKSVNSFNMWKVSRELSGTDLFISGGGSLLQDATSTRSLMYYLSVIKLAKLKGKKVYVYANGIGPITKSTNRLFTKKVLDSVDYITMRDNHSMKFVEDLGVKNKNMMRTADPVFKLEKSSETRVNEILNESGLREEKEIIGLNIREWKKSPNLINELSSAIDKIINKYDVNILLIPMHFPDDLNISLKFREMCENKDRIFILGKQYTAEELMGVTSRLKAIISMRLHALIYAATQYVPMFGLVYDPKVGGLLSSLGQDYSVDVTDFSQADFLNKFDDFYKNMDLVLNNLHKNCDDMEYMAGLNVKIVGDLLGGVKNRKN